VALCDCQPAARRELDGVAFPGQLRHWTIDVVLPDLRGVAFARG
jgi:hypothetical protein